MPTSVNMAYFPDTRLLATYEVEGVAAQYVNFANVPMLGGAEMEPPTTAPSRSAPVELVAEAFAGQQEGAVLFEEPLAEVL